MLIHVPDHFSSKFAFDLAKLPSAKTDRSSLLLAVSGWICGTLLLCLGIFELFSFITAEKGSGQSFLAVEIFAFIIVLSSAQRFPLSAIKSFILTAKLSL